jgi:hypothetical protein
MKVYFLLVVLLIVDNACGASYSIVDVVTATSHSITGAGDVSWTNIANIYSASTTDFATTSGSMSMPNMVATDSLKFNFTLPYRGLKANSGISITGIKLDITAATSSAYFNSFDISKDHEFRY